jgi:chromosome segregation ATPase
MSLTKDDLQQISEIVNGIVSGAIESSETRILGVINEFASSVDERFNQVDERLDRVEGRLDKVESRLDKVETRLDSVEHEIVQLKFTVKDNTEHLENLMFRVNSVENQLSAINSDLDEIYTKIAKLEKAPKSVEKKLRAEIAEDILSVNEKVKLVAEQVGVKLPA